MKSSNALYKERPDIGKDFAFVVAYDYAAQAWRVTETSQKAIDLMSESAHGAAIKLATKLEDLWQQVLESRGEV